MKIILMLVLVCMCSIGNTCIVPKEPTLEERVEEIEDWIEWFKKGPQIEKPMGYFGWDRLYLSSGVPQGLLEVK